MAIPIITCVEIKNFKKLTDDVFELNPYQLLVGPNNSGKSTLLQAIATWGYCVNEWKRQQKTELKPGKISKQKTGVQILKPEFYPVPVPEFDLLWSNRKTRWFDSKKKEMGEQYQGSTDIDITLKWIDVEGNENEFGVELYYQTPATAYIRIISDIVPASLDEIKIAHIPPFSGLNIEEKRSDESVIRSAIGQGQPGSVLRTILLRLFEDEKDKWELLVKDIEDVFHVRIIPPEYDQFRTEHIKCNYVEGSNTLDLVNAGSGLHQFLTYLAINYWSGATHLLIDEPDAHLFRVLQGKLLDTFTTSVRDRKAQVLIATHSTYFINSTKPRDILSFFPPKPKPLVSEGEREQIGVALGEVDNQDVLMVKNIPVVLYVEGQSDVGLLKTLARKFKPDLYDKLNEILIKPLGGRKPELAKKHFWGLTAYSDGVSGICLLDRNNKSYNDAIEEAKRYTGNGLDFYIWRRRHIESYLLVPPAIKRVAGLEERLVDEFLIEQLLPADFNYVNDNPPVLLDFPTKSVVFGLYNRQPAPDEAVPLAERLAGWCELTPELIASELTEDELHNDVKVFLDLLQESITSN